MLSSGMRLGPYEILSAIGVGGMGEVYRAGDTKLNRDVALKILPDAFAADLDRLARFRREAQVLASLNHPNIAAIYGFEDSGDTHALVLELVEGPTLADRIAKGAIPLDEALPIAKQIAEALEAAHEQGIIHRDLKPANIKVREDGTVKVLDFGLAKAMEPTGVSAPSASLAPTLTTPAMTGLGMILGTAAYMAPEQARGKPADKRADIWAFGCVLYEMLTGKRAFAGDDVTDTLASVLRSEPDWQLLPANLPETVRTLIHRSLDKDPRHRPSHLSVATFLLAEDVVARSSAPLAITAEQLARGRRHLVLAAAAALIVGAALASVATAWLIRRERPPEPNSPIRFTLAVDTGGESWRVTSDRPLALSPNGRALVYRGRSGNTPQLFIRGLDVLEPRPLFTGNVRAPFFSPDGQWVAFFVGSELRKVRVSGGPVTTICRVGSDDGTGSWGDDDSIVFSFLEPSPTTASRGLMVIPASGGEPKVLTTVDSDHGELAHTSPLVLPNSRGVLFKVMLSGRAPWEGRLMMLDRLTGQRREIAAVGNAAQYTLGHVVYADEQGRLQSMPFDIARLAPSGPTTPLAERVHVPAYGPPFFSVAASGALAFMPAVEDTSPESLRSLVWVNREGREELIGAAPRAYAAARLSPDGRQIALDVRDQTLDIWIWSIDRGTLSRLTSDPAPDMVPVWTPDGRRIVWTSTRDNIAALYWQAADGTGVPERLVRSGGAPFPGAVTPDGGRLLFSVGGASEAIRRVTLTGDHAVDDVLRGPGLLTPELSPDGRWMAYQSNESGEPEIYVRPYPNVEGGRWQISSQGGTRPAWGRNGRELFFLDATERLSVAPIAVNGGAVVPGAARRLLENAYYPGFSTRGFNVRGYDISPDGQRFLMIKGHDETAASRSVVTIAVNWSPGP